MVNLHQRNRKKRLDKLRSYFDASKEANTILSHSWLVSQLVVEEMISERKAKEDIKWLRIYLRFTQDGDDLLPPK